MSQTPPPADFNPFEAPRTRIGVGPVDVSGVDTDAELTRRQYLSHEASVRSIGSLFYLGAGFFGLAAAGGLLASVMARRDGGLLRNGVLFVLLISSLYLALAVAQAAVGHGLRILRPWARWVAVALMGLVLLTYLGALVVSFAMGQPLPMALVGFVVLICLIPSYVLYLLLGASGSVVFSSEYREVVRQTPHIRYRTSLLLKILAGLLVALFVLGIIMAISRPGR